MVLNTAPQLSSLAMRGYACTIGLVFLIFASHAHAQGANVDLSQREEQVGDVGDDLQSVENGVTLVYFAFGAEALEPEPGSQSALQRFAEQAKANPDSTILINAYTDNRGWALGNLELSRIRARSVAIELIANGIDLDRMRAFAFGEARPVALNNTAEGRRLNRRVEVSLIP